MAKRIAIIGVVGIPANYGGFETLIENLTKHLGETFELTVFCSSKSYRTKRHFYNNARLIYIPLKANGIQSILYDILSILIALRFADLFLILGVSGCIALPFVKLFTKIKIVINIDGLEWKRAKWNRFAKWFLKFSERLAVKYSDEVISDNKAIQDYVTREYGVISNLIEYGGDHVEKLPLSDEIKNKYSLSENAYAFMLCRVESERSINIVLDAFSQIDFPLILVGNFDNNEYGKTLIRKYSGSKNIQIYAPVYDKDKLNQLRGNAALYVHAHGSGGTNPSLVEAMFFGIPIVAYDVVFNRQTTDNKALYFANVVQLKEILKHFLEGSIKINEDIMKEIALKRYTWQRILKKYEKILIKEN